MGNRFNSGALYPGGALMAMAVLPQILTASVLDIFSSRQGEGLRVGEPHLFVRFGGCNVVCDYCDTPESIPAGSGVRMDLDTVLCRLQTCSSTTEVPSRVVSLTGGEPLLQVRFLEQFIPLLRERGYKIYLETNGTLPSALERVVHGCDWIAMDFKPHSAIGRDVWEAHTWFLKIGGSKIFVKMVLTSQTTEAEMKQAVQLLREVNCSIPLVLQPASEQPGVSSIPLPRLESWWKQAQQHLNDVRIIPQVHRLWEIA